MLKTHEHKGRWWLADRPDQPRSGTLTITQGRAELEVLGNFGWSLRSATEERVFHFGEIGEQCRIVGLTWDKKKITLEGAHISSFPGDLSTYVPPWTLLGKEFEFGEQIVFDEMAVELSDLDAWTGQSGFTFPDRDDDLPDARLSAMFDIKFSRPETIEIPLDGGEHASIVFSPSHSGWPAVPTSVTVGQRAYFKLRFAEPHSLNALARRVGQLRNFFCLAVGRPVSVLSVTGYQDSYRRPEGDTPLPIDLFWEIPHNPEPPADQRHPIKMAFTLLEAPGGLSEALRAWFGMQERFAPVFDLYFGMRYHPDVFGELRFLAYAQAIESYDRRKRSTGSAIDQRLRVTLKQCPKVRANLLKAGGLSLKGFLSAFADSRNYYTHYTADRRQNSEARRGVLLYVLTVQLQAVIEMVLLRHQGFSDEEIDQIFETRLERYREIEQAREQASDEDLVVPQE